MDGKVEGKTDGKVEVDEWKMSGRENSTVILYRICSTDSVVCIKIGKFDNRSNKDGFQAIKTDNYAIDHVS